MSTDTPPEAPVTDPPKTDDDNRIPRERLNQESSKRKAAEQKAAELQERLEALEAQGLSETEQERKAREKAEKKAAEYEQRIEQMESQQQRAQREQWVTDAAQELNFKNPRIAAKLVDGLDSFESAQDAQRAVKALAKSDDYLLKGEEPKLPGQVLKDGQTVDPAKAGTTRAADEEFAKGMLEQINELRSKPTSMGSMFGQ